MEVLQDILKDSKEYYVGIKRKIEGRLRRLPAGSIKERTISGGRYFYLQKRSGKKVIHKYLGKKRPEDLMRQLKERRNLQAELRKADEALRILKKTERRKT